MQGVIEATSAVSVPTRLEAKAAFKMLYVGTKKYCVTMQTSFREQEEPHSMETGSALLQAGSLELVDFSYSTFRAREQASSAQGLCSRENIKNARGPVIIVMAPETRGHTFVQT